jgi:hypothetical protein
MNCLTGKDVKGAAVDFNLYGPDENSPHRRLEFLYKPCTPTNFNPNKNDQFCTVPDVNNKDDMAKKLKEIQNYVGAADLVLMFN